MPKAPWFKMWAAEFLADNYVDAMTAEQVGWYCLLLMRSWINTPQGYLPNNKQLLSKWCRFASPMSFEFEAKIVLDLFKETADGAMIYHPKLLEQVGKYADVCEKRKVAGKKGGTTTASKSPSKNQANATPIAAANDQQLPTELELEVEVESTKRESCASDPPLDSDFKVQTIWETYPVAGTHPRSGIPPAVDSNAIIDAIIRHGYEPVLAGTRNYRDAVERWPPGEKRFIRPMTRFFAESSDPDYLKDPAVWKREQGNGRGFTAVAGAGESRTRHNLSEAQRAIQRELANAEASGHHQRVDAAGGNH